MEPQEQVVQVGHQVLRERAVLQELMELQVQAAQVEHQEQTERQELQV